MLRLPLFWIRLQWRNAARCRSQGFTPGTLYIDGVIVYAGLTGVFQLWSPSRVCIKWEYWPLRSNKIRTTNSSLEWWVWTSRISSFQCIRLYWTGEADGTNSSPYIDNQTRVTLPIFWEWWWRCLVMILWLKARRKAKMIKKDNSQQGMKV